MQQVIGRLLYVVKSVQIGDVKSERDAVWICISEIIKTSCLQLRADSWALF